MSRKNSSKRSPEYKWLGHIQVHFNDQELIAFLEYASDLPFDLETAVVTITQALVGIKFIYDQANDGYRCVLQPKEKSSKYYGYTLGFNHLELARVVQVAMYINDVLMEHEAIPLPNNEPMPDW